MLESVNLTAYVVLGFAMSYLALKGGGILQPAESKINQYRHVFSSRSKPNFWKSVG